MPRNVRIARLLAGGRYRTAEDEEVDALRPQPQASLSSSFRPVEPEDTHARRLKRSWSRKSSSFVLLYSLKRLWFPTERSQAFDRIHPASPGRPGQPGPARYH